MSFRERDFQGLGSNQYCEKRPAEMQSGFSRFIHYSMGELLVVFAPMRLRPVYNVTPNSGGLASARFVPVLRPKLGLLKLHF